MSRYMGVQNPQNFDDVITMIRKEDTRFSPKAYHFVRNALDFTVKQFEQQDGERPAQQHVSGQELLGGIRDYALDQFGPMTVTVFDDWGISDCTDFGDIVFHLVDYGVLGKSDTDSVEDFKQGYSFQQAFVKPFQPGSRSR